MATKILCDGCGKQMDTDDFTGYWRRVQVIQLPDDNDEYGHDLEITKAVDLCVGCLKKAAMIFGGTIVGDQYNG